MEVLLLTDIAGVGKKNDLLVVKSGYALNHLLPLRKALVVTPNVRKRYAAQIKQRAMERDTERAIQTSLSSALSGKTVHIRAKASKASKLYAAISEKEISDVLKNEYGIDIPAGAVKISETIKSLGKHSITIVIGAQSQMIMVEVKALEEAKAA